MVKARFKTANDMKLAVIGDEDTVTGMVLGGMGMVDGAGKKNFMVVGAATRVHEIEEAFHEYTTRKDISIVLITQQHANLIRPAVDMFAAEGKMLPTILEIPNKEVPYDHKKDPIMQRVQMFFGGQDIMHLKPKGEDDDN